LTIESIQRTPSNAFGYKTLASNEGIDIFGNCEQQGRYKTQKNKNS
jgi:hypothetical protein